MPRKLSAFSFAQVRQIEQQNKALATELRAAIGEVERLAHEVTRPRAAQGCEYCGSIGDAPHGEYCRTWEGGDA